MIKASDTANEYLDVIKFSDLIQHAVRKFDLLKFFKPTLALKLGNFIPHPSYFQFALIGSCNILNYDLFKDLNIFVHRLVMNEDNQNFYVVTHDASTYLISGSELNNLIKQTANAQNLNYESFCANIINKINV